MSRCWLLASFLVLTTLHTAQAQRAESIPVGSVQQVLDPMDGFGLAGRRAHTATGFLALVEFGGLAVAGGIDRDLGFSTPSLIGLGAGAALSLTFGIWGAIRLRARRLERRAHLLQLPSHIALQQRDVRLTGPTALIVLGSIFFAVASVISATGIAITGDPRAALISLAYAPAAALMLGLGIRRTREHRRLRARFIGNGVAW
ncbi:MAG: hypothetical protein AAF411_01625 [Myxococcota bacterium]